MVFTVKSPFKEYGDRNICLESEPTTGLLKALCKAVPDWLGGLRVSGEPHCISFLCRKSDREDGKRGSTRKWAKGGVTEQNILPPVIGLKSSNPFTITP